MHLRDLASGPGDPAPLKAAERSMGAVLVEAGRLRADQAERILQFQRENGLRFGDAALRLGLLTQADIDFALARQFDHPYLQPGEGRVSPDLVSAYDPASAEVEALRTLRTELTLRWFDGDPARRALAIVSAARQEGRSYIAANLAVMFSQLGRRTLLVDADLRNPSQHRLFGLEARPGLSEVLSGRAGPEAMQPVPSLPSLTVLVAGTPPPNPQELLARPAFGQLLHQLTAHLDVLLLDSPAASETADAQILAVRAGATLIVARKNASRAWRVQGVSESVVQAKATIVGAVLNDF
jgi:chain length determinant protein tyrosine kinase EpsG